MSNTVVQNRLGLKMTRYLIDLNTNSTRVSAPKNWDLKVVRHELTRVLQMLDLLQHCILFLQTKNQRTCDSVAVFYVSIFTAMQMETALLVLKDILT